jgi:hypothetical protein
MRSVVVKRYLRRSGLAKELADELIAEHKTAMIARNVEELVAECLQVEQLCKNSWQYVLGMLFSDEYTNDVDDLGQSMKMATLRLLDTLKGVEQMAEKARELGHTITDATDLSLAYREIERIKEDMERKFPPVNPRMISESLEAYHRGECQSPEELLRESRAEGSTERQ